MPTFRYSDPIIDTFPNVFGGLLIGTVENSASSESLQAAYRAEQQAVRERLADTPLSEVDSLKGWREAFRTFGVDPTKYRSAAEALLRRLTKKDEIPSINTLVDAGNLVSIRYSLPVAIVDVHNLGGDVLTVHFATGQELFTPLGVETPEHPDVGEVVFTDASGDAYARRWCWRQSARSAARDDTTQIIGTIESHHPGGADDVRSALRDLRALLEQYAAFKGTDGTISKEQTTFSG